MRGAAAPFLHRSFRGRKQRFCADTRRNCMYTRTLKPEIMATMLPKDFPADKLSQPRYKMVVDKDVMVTMRDGVRVAVDVYRPDAPGRFPSLYATSPFQKDLVDLPQ